MEPKLVTHPDELAALERLTAEYLLTYALLQQDVRRTRRATLWQRRGTDWRILFHQGTLVQDER